MEQILDHAPRKVLSTGCSGSGKSTSLEKFLLNTNYDYRFVFDQDGEFQQRTGLEAARDPDELLAQIEERWAIFDPVKMFEGDLEGAFDFFCSWTFGMAGALPGIKIFGVDELQNMVTPQFMPRSFKSILQMGRRRALDSFLVTQQPNDIHNTVRNQFTEVISFQQIDENAIAFLKDVGFDPERIRALAPGQFLYRNLKTKDSAEGRMF